MKKLIYTLMFLVFASFANAQWSEQSSGVTTTLYSVFAVDDDVVWICGAGGKVLLTVNGGTNWSLTTSPNPSLDLYCIYGIDANNALVAGSGSTAFVYKTIDGGQSWMQVFSQAGGFINTISKGGKVTHPEELMLLGDPVGGRWTIFGSQNYGSTWDSSGAPNIPQAGTETGYNNSVYVIHTSGGVHAWFGTNNSRIYRLIANEGNASWSSQPTTGQANTLSIMFADTLQGALGGSTGMLSTSNGGSIWSSFPVIGTGSINGIVFGHNIGEVYYTRGSSVYYSANSGTNWVAVTTQTGTYQHMNRARSGTRNNFWAIRNNGGISKYTKPIGINVLSTEIPSTYSLSQNYPNPFNPTTKFRFDVPVSSQRHAFDLRLIVYDVLGREVTILVNEQLKPGTYEVDWNASNYPSGVYFYVLRTENFNESKTMILLK